MQSVFEATEDFLKTDLFRLKGHRDPKNDPLQADNGLNKTKYDPIKLSCDPLNDPLNKIQVQLLNALKTKPKANYATLAKILDISPATVKRNIQKKHRGQVFILDIYNPISYMDPIHLQ